MLFCVQSQHEDITLRIMLFSSGQFLNINNCGGINSCTRYFRFIKKVTVRSLFYWSMALTFAPNVFFNLTDIKNIIYCIYKVFSTLRQQKLSNYTSDLRQCSDLLTGTVLNVQTPNTHKQSVLVTLFQHNKSHWSKLIRNKGFNILYNIRLPRTHYNMGGKSSLY